MCARASIGIIACVFCLAQAGLRLASADSFGDLARRASSDGSPKVRAQSVMLLGRDDDPRAVPVLLRALEDKSPLVRAVAVQALGAKRDLSLHDAIARLTEDASPLVRKRARAALVQVTGPPPQGAVQLRASSGTRIFLVVGRMGDRTGQSSFVRDRMRDYVVQELRTMPRLLLGDRGPAQRGFVVDGTIKSVTQRAVRDQVEIGCEVELVISTYPSRSILMMASGQAAVQVPKQRFRPQHAPGLTLEALAAAVKSADQNLFQFLQAQR